VKSRELLVEINCKEVESKLLSAVVYVMVECRVVKILGFGCKRSNLLVAAGIAGDEKNWDTLYLYTVSDDSQV
jgi:hypothetical protein